MSKRRRPHTPAQAATLDALRQRGYRVIWNRVRATGMTTACVQRRLGAGMFVLLIRPDGAYIGAEYARRWLNQSLEDQWQS